jgi:hypothetical protein
MKRWPALVLVSLALAALSHGLKAEGRVFHNVDGTKNFEAELTGYDGTSKLVSVKLENGRMQQFLIDVLSKEDQAYVLENADRLALANDLSIVLKIFRGESRKTEKDRITDHIYPTGYTISIRNRGRNGFENVTLDYTLFYKVQGYTSKDRELKQSSGTLECKVVPPASNISRNTETVDIVSGKLDALLREVARQGPDGQVYTEMEVVEPGGRRKDYIAGCLVRVLMGGKVVKTVAEGDEAKLYFEKVGDGTSLFPITPE